MPTDVLDRARPALSALARMAERRPPALVGVLTGLGAAVLGYLVVAALTTLVWLGTSPESWSSLLPFTMLGWVASHGLPVVFGGTTISLVPWGWVVVPVLALIAVHRRTGSTADLRGPRDAGVLVIAASLTYGLCVAIAAVLSDRTGANVLVRQALWQSVAIALVILALSSPLLRAVIPAQFHIVVRSAVAAFLVMASFAVLLIALSLVTHLVEAADLFGAVGGGVLGGLGLLLLQLGYLPVLVVWAMAFMTGAPIELSADGVLSPFLAAAPQAELPTMPILTAIPQSVPIVAWLLPVVVVLAGAVAGSMISRSMATRAMISRALITRATPLRALHLLRAVAASAVITGVLVALASLLASGSLGTQRLAGLGPDWLLAGTFTIALVAIGALPTAFVISRAQRRPNPPVLEVIE